MRRRIEGLFGRTTFHRGEAYEAEGRVIAATISSDRAHLHGEVRGSGRRIYAQSVELGWSVSGRLTGVEGTCSCPVGWNCKHVVAALLAVEARLRGGAGAAPRAFSDAGLSFHIEDWLAHVAAPENDGDPEAYAPGVSDRLCYVVERGDLRGPTATPMKSRILKSGELSGKAKVYSFDNLAYQAPAKFLRPSDLRILGALRQANVLNPMSNRHRLPDGEPGQWTMREIVATG